MLKPRRGLFCCAAAVLCVVVLAHGFSSDVASPRAAAHPRLGARLPLLPAHRQVPRDAELAAETPGSSRPELVAVYSGPGTTVRGVRNFNVVLSRRYQVAEFSAADIQSGQLRERGVALLVVPGGGATTIARGLAKSGLLEIRSFVSSGGGYLGVCAGAYLTAWGTSFPWKWSATDALSAFAMTPKPKCSVTGRCVQKGASHGRGTGGAMLRPAPELLPLLANVSALEDCAFSYRGGPVYDAPADLTRAAAANPRVLAHFFGSVPLEAKLVERGFPPAVSGDGLAFAVASEYGRGTVVALGPHPEQDAKDHFAAKKRSPEDDLLHALARYAIWGGSRRPP